MSESNSEKERLLSLLEAHGHAFLKSIGSEITYSIEQSHCLSSDHKRRKVSDTSDANAEEWHGINTNMPPHQYREDESSEIGTQSFHYSPFDLIPSQGALNIQMMNSSPTILQPMLSSTLMLFRENR